MTALCLVDVAATLVALPTLAKDLYAVAFTPRGGSVSEHLPARVFRRLDALTDHLMSPASYLAFTYLLARLGYVAATSQLALGWKLLAWLALVAVLLGLIYPLLWVYNTAGWIAWRNPPIHLEKSRYFPNSALLEDPDAYRAIRRELLAVLADSSSTRRFIDVFQNVTFVEHAAARATDAHAQAEPAAKPAPGASAVDGWRTFFLRMGNRDVPENHARMPTLSAALKRMPEAYTAFFSILDPGVSLAPHRGYFKGFLRYHLGMVVPEPRDAWLIVGGERYHWEEGAGVLFDDMFVHSVENHCRAPRIVLFMDIRRPMGPLGRWLSEIVGWVIDRHPYHRTLRDRL